MNPPDAARNDAWPWLGAALRLALHEPAGVAAHAQAYAALLQAESAQAAAYWRQRVFLVALALCAGATATGLTGVALLLWATLPYGAMPAPVGLVLVPLVPWLASLGCALAARRVPTGRAFEDLRQQWRADAAWLSEQPPAA